MVHWINPQFTRSRIRAAGKRIRDNQHTAEDVAVLENFRASHTYIMNTFNANLRLRSRGKDVVVAQRLKRRHTIFDKLRREPNMQLHLMHDVAGSRLIFKDQDGLNEFRDSFHRAKFEHLLKTRDNDRYNYVQKPKETGYRGIHDVYEYRSSSLKGERWNGLQIEIQYRTRVQHAWATAVEVADLINTSRIKFDEADQHHRSFFRLASEIMARAHEGGASCLSDLSNEKLLEEFRRADKRTGLILAFRNLQGTSGHLRLKMNTILIFDLDTSSERRPLMTETFDSLNRAITRYEALEKEFAGTADIVLVRSATPEAIRDAFRNYFSDVGDFLKYLDSGRKILAPRRAAAQ
ncbi:RelA/SpoT domain-containing protein [Methylorubrum sp. GM97]|uniref:RelA/SpoT domain-containing protein n=1 Tax=Methylorubrum sp. GM97 TaxID=2938232 RepID=UPI00218C6CE3|nr:RelA/SpoT domain-containing protein [Methylorubrum sp. GM97]BDL42417.1 GTP pyrophosphokinase [Methylorubrum sp. GM97]